MNFKRSNGILLYTLLSAGMLMIGNVRNLYAADFTREQIVAMLKAKMPGKDAFSHRDLSGLDLSGLSFAGYDLFGVNLNGSKLVASDLSGANLDRATMKGIDLTDANLSQASLYAAILDKANLKRAKLTGTRFIGFARNADFTEAKIIEADWGADPANQGMVPVRVDLTNANFSGADLTGTNFVHAILEYADFRDAQVVRVLFDWAKLSGAKFTGADTKDSSFKNAYLDGASVQK